jgi:hypothetical protein
LNTSNQLNSDSVDFSLSNIQYADYPSSITSKLASLDGQISTLTSLQDGDIANFTAIDNNFTTIEGQITTLETNTVKFPYLANVTSDVQSQIDGISGSSLPSISYDSGTTTTTITNTTKVATMKFADLTEQTSGFTTALKASVLDNVAKVAQNTTNISQNTNNIALKQNILNNTTNKLPLSNVDLTGSNLLNMDYTSSVNSKMTSLDNTLASQLTLNSSIASDITNLASTKQSLLNNSSNKLNPSFIDAGTATLTNTKMQHLGSINSDIQTQFNSKASKANETFTGTTTMATLNVGSIYSSRIFEKLNVSQVSFASNKLTYDYMNSNSILYFVNSGNTANNELALINVPPDDNYSLFTFSVIMNVSSSRKFFDKFSINGTLITMIANGGLANVDVSALTNVGMILQQFTIIYGASATVPFKVITNVTQFY